MAILTPVWQNAPGPVAAAFIRRSLQETGGLLHSFIAPHGLDTSWYHKHFPESRIARFSDNYFQSSRTYSQLLTGPDFYDTFRANEFITICQTDAVLLANPALVDMDNLDYLGAPWNPPLRFLKIGRRLYITSDFGHTNESRIVKRFGNPLDVGNGGLSIRRVSKHIEVTQRLPQVISQRYRDAINEDALLCSIGPSLGLRVASRRKAREVFLESEIASYKELPPVTGFHAIELWNPKLTQQIINSLNN